MRIFRRSWTRMLLLSLAALGVGGYLASNQDAIKQLTSVVSGTQQAGAGGGGGIGALRFVLRLGMKAS